MRRKTSPVQYILIGGIMLIALIWVLFPFYWALVNSIKRPADTFRAGAWIPFLQFQPTLEHWISELSIIEIRQALLNSTIISLGAATLAVLLGTLAAYALARFRFGKKGNANFTTWFISQRILPPVVVVIPFFLIMRQLQLLDNVFSLVLLNATFTLPFPVIILSQMIRELPQELEEAAYVDGASVFQAFTRVVLPLILPGLVATWIICMAFSWNEFLFALSLTTKSAIPMPVIIAGAEHTRGVQFWFVGVRVMLTMLPPIVFALLAQRYIIRGLTLGAVKG
ncbi:MAG: binding-protein-dependent transport systems inner membrane component [Chloroflexota bacterium]|jgi:multiple sugar transport system permease protein|nr:MAG: binding-protein-dependent transport systems inner membrane component [Chloroflexota bacterium]